MWCSTSWIENCRSLGLFTNKSGLSWFSSSGQLGQKIRAGFCVISPNIAEKTILAKKCKTALQEEELRQWHQRKNYFSPSTSIISPSVISIMASASPLKNLASIRAFGGHLKRFEHTSKCLGGVSMKFAVYVPDQATGGKIPTLYYLSGLTCTDENVCQKGSTGRTPTVGSITEVVW